MTKIDAQNEKILRELTRDGRLSNLDLAARVGLSPSACLRRVQELERSGIIKGYRAVLDPARLGVGFTAYVAVGLSNHTKAGQEGFERAIAHAPERSGTSDNSALSPVPPPLSDRSAKRRMTWMWRVSSRFRKRPSATALSRWCRHT